MKRHVDGVVRRWPLASALGMIMASSGVSAQLEEIVVTAQKREQSLQDVPLAVSAFSGDALENQQIFSADDLAQLSPTISVLGAANSNNRVLRVRGIGTQSFGAGVEPSVSMVIDGVVLARQSQGFQDLLDLERIEILRGPQGTLFGKNASAGVIHYVTKNPTSEFESLAEVTVAEDQEYRVRGYVSGPISETVGYRLTGFGRDVGGFHDNVFDGSELNGTDSWGLRGKLSFEPNDSLNLLLSADYSEQDDNCCQPLVVGLFGQTAEDFQSIFSPAEIGEDSTSTNVNAPVFNETEDWGLSLTADYEMSLGTLTSITAVREWNGANNADVDHKPFQPSTPGIPFEFTWERFASFRDIEQFSQELRIASPSGERAEWVAGLFYWQMEMDVRRENRLANCGKFIPPNNVDTIQPCPVPFFTSGFFDGTVKNSNAAVFGQLNYDLTDSLEVYGGLRVLYESLETATLRPDAPLPEFPEDGVESFGAPPLPYATDTDDDDTAVTGRLGFQYAMSDNARVFASFSRGYKGASVNVDNVSSNDIVNPEIVNSVEAGIKAELLNNRLAVSLIAYSAEYDDFQSQSLVQSAQSSAFQLTNAGVVTTDGIEFEFSAAITDGFTVSGGAAYTDAVFDEFEEAQCYLGQTESDGCVNGVQDLSGKKVPNAPEWKFNVLGRYEFPLGSSGYSGFMQGAYVWQDEVVMREDNNPKTIQGDYGILDANIGLISPEDRYSLTLFVRNLTDESFGVNRIDFGFTGVGAPVAQFRPKNADRYAGLTFRMKL